MEGMEGTVDNFCSSPLLWRSAVCDVLIILILSIIFLSAAISAEDKTQKGLPAATSAAQAGAVEEKSQQVVNAKESENAKYEIIDGVAKKFTQDEKKGIIVFEGNVKINRENGYLNANKVTIYRDVKTNDVIKTVAEGNVDMKDGDILATCEHAVLNEVDDTIELTGSVVVIQREDRIEAPYITYNRRTGIRKGRGNETETVRFRVRIKKKEETKTQTASEDKGVKKD